MRPAIRPAVWMLSWGLAGAGFACATNSPKPLTSTEAEPSRPPVVLSERPPIEVERARPVATPDNELPARRDIRRLPTVSDLAAARRAHAQLEQLLRATSPSDPVYADMLFRLAIDEQALVVALLERAPDTARSEAEHFANSARVHLEPFVSEPQLLASVHAPEALFMLAYLAFGNSDRAEQGAEATRALILNFPASDWVPAAMVEMGEQFARSGNPAGAALLFEKALSFRGPDRAYALAALASAQLQAARETEPDAPRQALERAAGAYRSSFESRHVRGPGDAEAARARAKLAMVEAYARVGEPSRATEFFAAQFGADLASSGVLSALADRYRRDGKSKALRSLCASATGTTADAVTAACTQGR